MFGIIKEFKGTRSFKIIPVENKPHHYLLDRQVNFLHLLNENSNDIVKPIKIDHPGTLIDIGPFSLLSKDESEFFINIFTDEIAGCLGTCEDLYIIELE